MRAPRRITVYFSSCSKLVEWFGLGSKWLTLYGEATSVLTDFMNTINNAMDIITENDQYFKHSTKLKRGVYDIACYKETLCKKKLQPRQLICYVFLEKKAKNCSESEPQLGQSSSATGHGGPYVCETSRLLYFLDNWPEMTVRLLALCASHPLPQKDTWWSFMLGVKSTPGP